MSAVLQRIASLANGLGKAELHILLELAAQAEAQPLLQTTASSRELALRTGLARASVQAAIDSLNRKQLIQSEGGGATQSAVHRLICLGTIEESIGGPKDDSQVAQNLDQGGLRTEPGVGQSGLKIGPGVAQELSQGGLLVGPLPDAKSSTDETLFELARNRIASHHAKFARPENRQPSLPDDVITAQFLTVAEWPKLEAMLLDLASERKEAGHSYGWYVTVALQRIHGISPERLRKMRGRVKSGASGPALVASRGEIARKPPAVVEVEQLKEEIRALAAARSIR
jgi:hypothetical protein